MTKVSPPNLPHRWIPKIKTPIQFSAKPRATYCISQSLLLKRETMALSLQKCFFLFFFFFCKCLISRFWIFCICLFGCDTFFLKITIPRAFSSLRPGDFKSVFILFLLRLMFNSCDRYSLDDWASFYLVYPYCYCIYTRKHSLLDRKLTQHDGKLDIVGKWKVVPRNGSIIIHIVRVSTIIS